MFVFKGAPPATLAEFTLGGGAGGTDWYDGTCIREEVLYRASIDCPWNVDQCPWWMGLTFLSAWTTTPVVASPAAPLT